MDTLLYTRVAVCEHPRSRPSRPQCVCFPGPSNLPPSLRNATCKEREGGISPLARARRPPNIAPWSLLVWIALPQAASWSSRGLAFLRSGFGLFEQPFRSPLTVVLMPIDDWGCFRHTRRVYCVLWPMHSTAATPNLNRLKDQVGPGIDRVFQPPLSTSQYGYNLTFQGQP